MASYPIEQLTPDFGFYLRASHTLFQVQSEYQLIEVLDTPQFGRVLRIDGCFMTSEQDEFFYHEPMAHLPALAHPAPETALIVGGGDGGMAEELLKHPSIRQVVMAELDPVVVETSKAWLPAIHGNVFSDPRLEVRIVDGKALVEQSRAAFDLIILDLTDPFGPAQALYTADFYRACRAALKPGGLISLHLQSPIHRPRTLARIVASLGQAFPLVRPALGYVPLYGTLWAFGIASDGQHDPARLEPAEVDRRIAARNLQRLQLYNGTTHAGLLAQPGFLRELLAHPAVPIDPATPLEEIQPPGSLPSLHLVAGPCTTDLSGCGCP
ncbi:polyamine aminopropyltransferase [Azovibrio restrictus]|uniref:polyamine aminopropyltransferase n=1 Tax=Azovibrio restrictus TaxID=146938 RepID=UPI0026E9F942|nr:polyamine aminopropyltransferase [Azovibrio restrictus]